MNGLPTTNGRVKVIKGREFGVRNLASGDWFAEQLSIYFRALL